MTKKVGIIGSGVVGQTLAKGFVTHGYAVMIGTNTPAKQAELAAAAALHAASAANLAGKTVIDATNPMR